MINKIKIVHLLYSGLGGHSSVFLNLAKDSSTFNFVHVGFFCGIEDINESSRSRCEENDIRYSTFKKQKGFDLNFYSRIFSALSNEKPKIIFLHGASLLLPVFFYKIFNLSVKVIVRDTQAAHLKRKSEWILLGLAFFISNKLVFLTQDSLESLRRKMGLLFRKKRTTIIPNGIDHQLFKNKIELFNENSINIGMQSRLQLIKDHPTLIKAFKVLLDKFPNMDFKLHIAGDGDTLIALKSLVKELNIDGKVTFYGMLDEIDLIQFMDNLNVYVHATFGETMSNSILQAMSFGLPIVASDVWGVNNLIKDNENGLLYESENIQELADKIYAVINQQEMGRKLGDQARLDIETVYSSTVMVESYEKAFIDLFR